jgi:predicted dehydrogenase
MAKHTRREILIATAGVGVWSVARLAQSRSPGEKLNLGFIGVTGRGGQNMDEMAGENVAALCDVDERHLGKAAESYPNARKYRDFRKMIDEATDLDAVVISTPHHIHAHATARALAAGKHVYCEKPLTHTVWEARRVAELAAKHKVATQHGTNAHTFCDFQRAVELIQGGAIGPVREAHVWCDESYGGASRPQERLPVPEYLDWDLWLGPSPERPYHKAYHPYGWHYYSDFGEGTVGNMGPHLQDLPFWALKLRYPLSVEAEGPPVDPESPPKWLIVRYEYGARDELPPVKLTWYHGGKHPSFPEGFDSKGWGQGILFMGEKGQLAVDYHKLQLFPQATFADFPLPKSFTPESNAHHAEWIRACKTGEPTSCPFEYAGPLAEAVQLGLVAYRVGRRIEWDAANLQAKNCPEADRFIRPDYRKGWEL